MVVAKNQPANILRGDVVVVAQDLVSADLEREAVILNLKDGVYYGLDPMGARIWNLIQQPRSVTEIIETLLEEYEVEPQRLSNDLLGLLKEMAARGLIEVRGGTAS